MRRVALPVRSSYSLDAIDRLPPKECGRPPFQHVLNRPLGFASVNRASLIRLADAPVTAHWEDDLGITEDSNIGIVRDDKDLSTFLDVPEGSHNTRKYECVVEIVLRLVDNQRLVRLGQ